MAGEETYKEIGINGTQYLASALLDDSYRPKSLLLNRLHRHNKS